MGPFLQQLAQAQQEHDRARPGEIPASHRNANGQTIQQFNPKFSLQQAPNASDQVGDGFENRIRRRQGRREETFPYNLKDDLADELFLISPVQSPSAMRRRQFGNLWCVVRKPAQKSQQGGSFSAILNHRAARPFMYRRLPNGGAVIQIGFQ